MEACLEKIEQRVHSLILGQQKILQKITKFTEKIRVQLEGSQVSNLPNLFAVKKYSGVKTHFHDGNEASKLEDRELCFKERKRCRYDILSKPKSNLNLTLTKGHLKIMVLYGLVK